MVHLRRLVRLVAILVVTSAVLAVTLVVVAPQAGNLVSAHRSDHERIDLGPLTEPSHIYDRNGQQMATLIDERNTNRSEVPLSQVPVTVAGSIVSVEDEHFYSHKGINVRSIARAASDNIDKGRVSQGGSTITQQLVKIALVGNEQNFTRKIREAVLSVEIEKQMTKQQILERYLNTVYFGNGAYGVQAASRVYFNKNVTDLNWAEGALLAALIRNPNQYNPFRFPDIAMRRRDVVFSRLVETGRLTADEAALYRGLPLPITSYKPPPVDNYFADAVSRQLQSDPRGFGLGKTSVFQSGLRIYTTYDPAAQLKAVEARDQTVLTIPGGRPDGTFPLPGINPLTGQENFGTEAIVSVEPATGAVRVMVGGAGFERYKLNLATQSRPQPGSSMKTFVLAALFENGYVPDDRVSGSTYVLPVPGQPNYVVVGGVGFDSIEDHTKRSSNPAFVRLGQIIGVPKVVDMAKRLGIPESPPGLETTALPAVPSLPLGTASVSPFDMAGAYAVLANDGVRNEPYLIERIEDRRGRVLYQHQAQPQRVLQPEAARMVTKILEANVRSGTGTRAQLVGGQPAAGKTGTTNENKAVWFVGYTPQLATAIWMGSAGNSIPMEFATGEATGGRFPASTWGIFMNSWTAGTPVTPFIPPAPTRSGQSLTPPESFAFGRFIPPLPGTGGFVVPPAVPIAPGGGTPAPRFDGTAAPAAAP